LYRTVTSQLLLALEPLPVPTLANFVPGANHAAVDALAAIASGGTAGAVYLWGETGTGKSHLLAAVRHGGDVVTLDDVDRLGEAAQLEAFDRFNRARAAGGSVVAAGTTAPALLAGVLREDLRSRVLSGLVFQLQPLADAEKAGALAAHAAERGMKLPPEAIDHLLARLPRGLGTQLAVLDAIDRYSLALKRPVTLPLVREALAALDLA
jgi:DnaA family protein